MVVLVNTSATVTFDKDVYEDLQKSKLSASKYVNSNIRKFKFKKQAIMSRIKDNEEENEMLRKKLERIEKEEKEIGNGIPESLKKRLFIEMDALKSNPSSSSIRYKILNQNFKTDYSEDEYLQLIGEVTGYVVIRG